MCAGKIPGRAAHRAGRVEICEPESCRRQAVQVGSERTGVSVRAQIPEPQIIREQQDEIRQRRRAGTEKHSQTEDVGEIHPAFERRTARDTETIKRTSRAHCRTWMTSASVRSVVLFIFTFRSRNWSLHASINGLYCIFYNNIQTNYVYSFFFHFG